MFPVHKYTRKPRRPRPTSVPDADDASSTRKGSNDGPEFSFSARMASNDMSPADELFCNGTIRAGSPSPERAPAALEGKPFHNAARKARRPQSTWKGFDSASLLERKAPVCESMSVKAGNKTRRKWSLKNMFSSRIHSEIISVLKENGLPPKPKNCAAKNAKKLEAGVLCGQIFVAHRCHLTPYEIECATQSLNPEFIKKKNSLAHSYSHRQNVLGCLRHAPKGGSSPAL